MELVPWARDLAERLLAEPLPRRWAHTQGVARQALTLAPILGNDADLVEAAAWTHDIGYSPALVVTDFHPLDGARYLRDNEHADERLCRLVAHHTCAVVEARERGLAQKLLFEFSPEDQTLSDALIFCDMTTGPNGDPVNVDTRITEILSRYDQDSEVAKAIREATPIIHKAVQATTNRLKKFSDRTL